MKRLGRIGAWRRFGLQAGVLAGIGLAFAGGRPPVGAAPPPGCLDEASCAIKKPMLLFVLDYSTSMNKDFGGQGTRWEVAVGAVQSTLVANNGFLISNYVVGLMRFGHDPLPLAAGTKIANDASGLVDGVKLDVPFYDPGDPDKEYAQCDQGDAIVAALDAVPAPLGGNLGGIYTWTRGALLAAQATFAAALADHPDDGVAPKRLRSIVLVTDGEWTNPQGNMTLMPASEDPALVAADLFDNSAIPTHVVALGEAVGKPFADEIAAMGGTGVAVDAATPQALHDGLYAVIEDVTATQLASTCGATRPRVMILLDASSSMLNLWAGAMRAPMGQGGWEIARESLAGDVGSIFEQMILAGPVESLMDIGLTVFGGNMPDESKLVVQYGACHRDEVKWALDPASSCVAPGCVDPYANGPITWTFQDGSMIDPPGFDEPVLSHMPRCNMGQPPNLGCFGSGTYTHLGLLRIQANVAAYKAQCMGPDPAVQCGEATPFINVLITDGQTNSTQAQYTAPLAEMFAAGVTTYVIGFGDGVDSPQAIAGLQDMADKGSGNTLDYYDANNQSQLEQALADILEGLPVSPCCKSGDCDPPPNGTEGDPDPVPPSTTSGTTEMTTSGTSTGTETGTSTSTGTSTGGTSTGGVAPGTTTTTGELTTTSGTSGASSGTGAVPTTGGVDPTAGGEEGGSSAGESGATTGTGASAEPGGCGCVTSGSMPGWWVLVAGLWRRRRANGT